MKNRIGPWRVTYTGNQFWPFDPRSEDFILEDIVQALSNMCRFNGSTKEHYSVGQHSVLVAKLLRDWGHPPLVILAGLLHDCGEPYLTDIPGPIKSSTFFNVNGKVTSFSVVERRILSCLSLSLTGVSLNFKDPNVHLADATLLFWEKRDCLLPCIAIWEKQGTVEIPDKEIMFWSPTETKLSFLTNFNLLMEEIHADSSSK